MVIVVALLCLLIHSAPVHAATYTVGDKLGWIFGVVNWPKEKTFKAGDKLGMFDSLLYGLVWNLKNIKETK